MNINEIFQAKKARAHKAELMELDTRIANCLTEQHNYEEELQDIDAWLDSWEKDSEGERFIALAEERVQRYDELIFLLQSSDLLFASLMKQKANLTANVELGTLVESIEELHKRMANTEATLQQIRDEQIETKALFDSWDM